MNTARYQGGGAAVVGAGDANAHRMLVVGGSDRSFRPINSCEVYDATTDCWAMQEARLPKAMLCLAAPIAGGSAVLAVQGDDQILTRCALLDTRSSSPCWQPMASPESAIFYQSVATVGEHSVVLLGVGCTISRSADATQLYDDRADRWSVRAEWRLRSPAHTNSAVVLE